MSGKGNVGIEIPNEVRETIYLREILESDTFRRASGRLTLGLGKTVNGDVWVTDLAAHAPPADRRLDRHRQERRPQLHDRLASCSSRRPTRCG